MLLDGTINFQADHFAADGQIVGSLGLIHERPRMFTDGDRQCLQDLIAVLERELHHHAQASSRSV